jgi:hypothetical protein
MDTFNFLFLGVSVSACGGTAAAIVRTKKNVSQK